MSFIHELESWPKDRVEGLIEQAQPADVDRALVRENRTVEDLAALLSPRAHSKLEAMAVEAQRLTRRHFGRTIGLYAPIYLSNVCASDCPYCGFAVRWGDKRKRVVLKPDTIRQECEALAVRGFQNVLFVAGEAPRLVTVDYLAKAVGVAREYFPSVCIEVYPLNIEAYQRLCRLGLEGVTLYQETYDHDTYARMHGKGVKRDYQYRLDALERAGVAGARRLNIGALLGLFNWRVDGFWLALHARYLQRRCWQSAVAISFPRLRHVPETFMIPYPVNDADLVQLLLALRLFLPEAGINLSTRERAEFRDRLVALGVTMMSAGSSTRPGGYATYGAETLEQFEIEDRRTPEAVAEAIRKAGYDPVWKDFDVAFDEAQPAGTARRPVLPK